ncbi:MAG: hypothetical protein KBT48_07970 [Firmicutes bacterium]|nr:hypothetical protein [Bacillota bacterium]
MNKERLKKSQPVVYRVLSNALTKNRLAHAYLFVGDKGSNKEETALLFAQSMVCENTDKDGFACQTCERCLRMENRESLDFIWISKETQMDLIQKRQKKDAFKELANKKVKVEKKAEKLPTQIKKEAITSLQESFSKTGQEQSDKRIYVIEQYDLISTSASNSLLKFIEEPQEGIYGILTTEEKSNVLPTIQSRCQIIGFKPESYEERMEELLEITNEENAEMLIQNGYTLKNAQEWIENEEFGIIKNAAREYINSCNDHASILKMQQLFAGKSIYLNKEYVKVLLEWLLYFVRNKKTELKMSQQVQIQTILVESMDVLRSPVDLGLFLDKIYNQLWKVVKS